MRIIVVVGARPNFIKVAPLLPALHRAGIGADLVHTGQHYNQNMSDSFFQELCIPEPDWNLGVGSGTHAAMTGLAMARLEELFIREKPDAVMVVGDVNSTLAGALAAVKLRIPVIHLEAGLRSGDMTMPEEVNRVIVDRIASMHLCPTEDSIPNLQREGISNRRIQFVGNIMAEAVLRNLDGLDSTACRKYALTNNKYILATIHRPENTDEPENMRGILAAFAEAPLRVLMPVHPRTASVLIEAQSPNVKMIAPVGYMEMLALQRGAAAIITDSGGIQEEACMVYTPCVTVRRNTERWVTLDVGANRLVSAEKDTILSGVRLALASNSSWQRPVRWDMAVSTRIVNALSKGVTPV